MAFVMMGAALSFSSCGDDDDDDVTPDEEQTDDKDDDKDEDKDEDKDQDKDEEDDDEGPVISKSDFSKDENLNGYDNFIIFHLCQDGVDYLKKQGKTIHDEVFAGDLYIDLMFWGDQGEGATSMAAAGQNPWGGSPTENAGWIAVKPNQWANCCGGAYLRTPGKENDYKVKTTNFATVITPEINDKAQLVVVAKGTGTLETFKVGDCNLVAEGMSLNKDWTTFKVSLKAAESSFARESTGDDWYPTWNVEGTNPSLQWAAIYICW